MQKPLAFSGNYSDFRLVKTRGVCQVIVELPIEQAGKFIEDFGVPQPATEIPVALARLYIETMPEPIKLPKPSKRFEDMPPATQAALTCQEPTFWAYVKEERYWDCSSEDDAARFVREWCEVESRAAIKPNTHAHNKWMLLVSAYQGWKAAERVGV